MNNVCIEMKDLGRRYGSSWVLAHLNLTIPRGQSVALFGNNGSGKTTLLRMIATLLLPSTGKLSVLGYDVTQRKRKIRNHTRFLGHEKQLYNRLTVMENMRLAAGIRKLPSKMSDSAIEEILEKLQIYEYRHQQIQNLSEGNKKRLVLSRLLLGDADLILLDEPHPTLDKRGKKILDDLICEWRDKGKTIILASHDHDLVLFHVDRLIILHEGHVHYDGSPMDPEKIITPEFGEANTV